MKTCQVWVIWNAKNTSITLYGDDPTTTKKDGLAEGETVRFRLYNSATEAERELLVEFDASLPDYDAVFKDKGLSAIQSLAVGSVSVDDVVLSGIRIYPNPAKEVLHIDLASDISARIKILNIHGQVMLEKQLDSKNVSINISSLPAGLYFVQVDAAHQKLTRKIVKE